MTQIKSSEVLGVGDREQQVHKAGGAQGQPKNRKTDQRDQVLHSVHKCSERLEHTKAAVLSEPERQASNQRYDSMVELMPKLMMLVGCQKDEN